MKGREVRRTATLEDRIIQILTAQKTVYVCDACLALKTSASLQEAQEAVARLEGLANFSHAKTKCSECLRVKPVVCASRVEAR